MRASTWSVEPVTQGSVRALQENDVFRMARTRTRKTLRMIWLWSWTDGAGQSFVLRVQSSDTKTAGLPLDRRWIVRVY